MTKNCLSYKIITFPFYDWCFEIIYTNIINKWKYPSDENHKNYFNSEIYDQEL